MTAVYTSITLSYLAKARVLAHSVKRHNPELKFYLVFSEPVPDWLQAAVDAGEEPFDCILPLEDLDIPDKAAWIFGHDVVEACTAVKGPALAHLQRRFGQQRVIYLDPDIVVFHTLRPILELLEQYSIVLTPHCTIAETELELIVANEVTSLAHGVYNLGFIAVASDTEGRRFADWWSHRLYHFCHDDIPRGLFTDQRWIDLVPAQFEQVKILRDSVYNVCSWNLTQRHVTGSLGEGIRCDGRPLCFHHFSGINSGALDQMYFQFVPFNKTLRELVSWYRSECNRHGEQTHKKSPWHYACYDNGVRITRPQRLLYRADPNLQEQFPDPFATGEDSYHEWLKAEGPGLQGVEEIFPQTVEGLRRSASRLRRIENTRAYKWYSRVHRLVRTVRRRAS